MARIELAPEVAADFDRILEHLQQHEVADLEGRIGQIIQAIAVLEHSPYIGRPVSADLRELLIGRRQQAYVALYRYVVALDTVFVLALRSQSEAGYLRD